MVIIEITKATMDIMEIITKATVVIIEITKATMDIMEIITAATMDMMEIITKEIIERGQR